MLQRIRDKIQGVFAKVIIALIAIPFALFGVDVLFGNSSGPYAAKVNGEAISEAALQQGIILQKNHWLARMGDTINPALLDDAWLQRLVLDRLIQEQLLLQSAQEYALELPDALIEQAIITMPEFQENGQFSPQLYLSVLRSNGYTPNVFKQLITKDMLIDQLRQGIAGSEYVTQYELTTIAKIIGEHRGFQYRVLPVRLTTVADPSPEQMKAYYDEHKATFQVEEQIAVNYIELNLADFYEPVDESRVREVYELEVAGFDSNEERRTSHLLLAIDADRSLEDTQILAQTLRARAMAGEPFGALAKQYSDDSGSAQLGGDLGYSRGSTFPEPFEEVLFSLQLNEISEPIQIDAGIHLIQVTDIVADEMPSFEERQLSIKQQIQATQAANTFFNTVEHLRDLAFNADDLKGPADELGLPLVDSGWLARSTDTGIFSDPQVRQALDSDEVFEQGYNSAVLEITPERFIVLRLDGYKPSEFQPLADVESVVAQALRIEQARHQALDEAHQQIKHLNAGEVQEHGAWHVVTDAKRDTLVIEDDLANRALLDAVFELPSALAGQEQYSAHVLPEGDVAIIMLKSVMPGSLSKMNSDEQQALSDELLNNAVSQSFMTYMQALRHKADITIND